MARTSLGSDLMHVELCSPSGASDFMKFLLKIASAIARKKFVGSICLKKRCVALQAFTFVKILCKIYSWKNSEHLAYFFFLYHTEQCVENGGSRERWESWLSLCSPVKMECPKWPGHCCCRESHSALTMAKKIIFWKQWGHYGGEALTRQAHTWHGGGQLF
jgi:hypothetical protein